jgi:hypothetical protein
MSWEPPIEKEEQAEEKQVCEHCGNDTFRVYIKILIDDARLYCAECGKSHF